MKRKFVLKTVLALGMAIAGLSSLSNAVAQTTAAYPASRVTLVTHSSPGGGTDVFLRDLAKYITPVMKTNFAVENIRGGSGAKAVAHVAKGPADGSMFYGTTPTYIQTTLLSKPSVGYDGLDPMLIVFIDPEVIFTRADSPFKTLQDVMAHAKANPGKSRWGASNPASLERIGMEKLARAAGVKVPTLKELGVANGVVDTWYGVLVPAGTPPEVVAKLNADFNSLLQLPDVKETMNKQGMVVVGGKPERMNDLVKNELSRWARVVEKAGIKPEN